MNTYGQRLELALEAKKMDRQWLASKLGISVQALSQVILGKTKALSAENHELAVLALGCSGKWLATGVGDIALDDVTKETSTSNDETTITWEMMQEHKKKRLQPLLQEARAQSDLWNAVKILRKLPVDSRKSFLDLLISSVTCDSDEGSEQLLSGFQSMLFIAAQYKKDP